jgi:alanyl-tRNA synthetase
MTSSQIRSEFLNYFREKGHRIESSAPMVVKNDPTLMFTNAGMNQFKDYFLGNKPVSEPRVANSQKCLRVSGKHNDLEEVGVDTYHHTMFEMLGNWSFGDYFKQEAIEWAWDLLTNRFELPKDRLYVTVFEGDSSEGLDFDQESYDHWRSHISEDRILNGSKKDNFWEMGDTGPCGPCSEIHIDLRPEEERNKVDGANLVNNDHPLVIEIWNLVFMEFNRQANGSLIPLPAKHVDTGMGFERLCMAMQGKKSNYDTDIFQPLIRYIESGSGIQYGFDESTDIAMRVIADHIRAITFAIADGQLPSNNKAGYVIRRILRRAVRYGYSFLNLDEPFLYRLVPVLAKEMGDYFAEIREQEQFIGKVILEEETSFLRTLETGIKKFESYNGRKIDGEFAFELYDTYGFPFDLTQLMAREKGLSVDVEGFNSCMEKQKQRSKSDAEKESGDWVIVHKSEDPTDFIGYEQLECETRIIRYREEKVKKKIRYQLVFESTPFYAESGGQVGDTGMLISGKEKIRINDTQKENDLIIHFTEQLPENISEKIHLQVDSDRRQRITCNHSATHLLHAALRDVLGEHVTQKGSLVNEKVTRFDFSHFTKLTDEELSSIEKQINEKIRENIALDERRNVPVKQALDMGAMALFGEKYGDHVRVITFDPSYSVELCGGTHVKATGEIGAIRITSESSVAAGVRRVEAVTAEGAESWSRKKEHQLEELRQLLNSHGDPVTALKQLLKEHEALIEQIEGFRNDRSKQLRSELEQKISENGTNRIIAEILEEVDAEQVKSISYDLRKKIPDVILLFGANVNGKPHLSLMIPDSLVKEKGVDASAMIRELAKDIKGGGGGQPFYATAGGKDTSGLTSAIKKGLEQLASI